MADFDHIIDFWIKEVGPNSWYSGTPDLDARIQRLFMNDWEVALAGGYTEWAETSLGSLAYLILTDQFPRNMFRDDARAFATDANALTVAKQSIRKDFDLEIHGEEQQFFYMPFEHSELIAEQDNAVFYMENRMRNGDTLILHAKVHHNIITKFDRFPYRNKVLGRMSTEDEFHFLGNNGYQTLLKKLEKT